MLQKPRVQTLLNEIRQAIQLFQAMCLVVYGLMLSSKARPFEYLTGRFRLIENAVNIGSNYLTVPLTAPSGCPFSVAMGRSSAGPQEIPLCIS